MVVADTKRYSLLRKNCLKSFVQSRQFVQLVDGPHAFLTVDSVEAAYVAVLAQRHAGEPLALVDLVAITGSRCPAHHAVHFLDPRDVLPL